MEIDQFKKLPLQQQLVSLIKQWQSLTPEEKMEIRRTDTGAR